MKEEVYLNFGNALNIIRKADQEIIISKILINKFFNDTLQLRNVMLSLSKHN